jgi:hypothetical protein
VTYIRMLFAGLSSRRPGFDPRPVHLRLLVDRVAGDCWSTEWQEIVGGQSGRRLWLDRVAGTGTGFSPSASSFRRQYHSAIAPYSSSSTRYSCRKDKQAKPGRLARSKSISEIGGVMDTPVLNLLKPSGNFTYHQV